MDAATVLNILIAIVGGVAALACGLASWALLRIVDHAVRLAKLEAAIPAMREDIGEIKTDVKALLRRGG